MTLNVGTGRAVLARPTINRGGEMANKAKDAAPARPVRLPMIRVCGRWQKPGYEADAEEKTAWQKRCKNRGQDPKTGKILVDPTAPSVQPHVK